MTCAARHRSPEEKNPECDAHYEVRVTRNTGGNDPLPAAMTSGAKSGSVSDRRSPCTRNSPWKLGREALALQVVGDLGATEIGAALQRYGLWNLVMRGRSTRPGFPPPRGFPRRSPSPGPAAGLSAIHQGCVAVHGSTRPHPYALGEAAQPHRAPGKARPRGLHGDLPDARTHRIARRLGHDRWGNRAGTAGHHKFPGKQLLRHRTRPRTPHGAARHREDRRVLRTGTTAGEAQPRREEPEPWPEEPPEIQKGCPGTEVPGQPLPLSLRPSAAVTRPCSGSAQHRRPPARSAGRPAAPTSPHPGR